MNSGVFRKKSALIGHFLFRENNFASPEAWLDLDVTDEWTIAHKFEHVCDT